MATLTAAVHGSSGVGKSWLGDTTPAPRLILDSEGGAVRLKSYKARRAIQWDPMTQEPPHHDGTWDMCYVTVADGTPSAVIDQAYTWLRSGQHPFKSVVLDSLMELQNRYRDLISGTAAVTTSQWGELLRVMESMVRKFRDLTLYPQTNIDCVLMLCGSELEKDGVKHVPYMQGSISRRLPYFFDVVGYMKNDWQDAEGRPVRGIAIIPSFLYEAKDRTDDLTQAYPSGIIPDPNIEQLMQLLVNGGPAPTPAPPVPVAVQEGVTA